MQIRVKQPPVPRNASGAIRGVGVEIEFAGLSPKQAAGAVIECYGGQAKPGDTQFVYTVTNTQWGDFRVELDAQVVHPEKDFGDIAEESAFPTSEENVETIRDLDTHMRELIGKVSAGLVPTEVVSPPIPWDDLDALSSLVTALRALGAKGTDEGFAYSFGVHLNPEAARLDANYLLSVLRAYVVLSDWLRERIDVNVTRRILPHVDPFPEDFAVRILQADYAPSLETLICDYFKANPTRNRELDMLPLFKYLAPETVAKHTDDTLIKARPTFHYRLPDTRLSDPSWGIVQEWNRWVAVERLAEDEKTLRRLADRHLAGAGGPVSKRLREVRQWLESLANP